MVGVQVESFPNVVSIPFRARQDKLNRSHDLHFSLARNKSSGLGGMSCFYPYTATISCSVSTIVLSSFGGFGGKRQGPHFEIFFP